MGKIEINTPTMQMEMSNLYKWLPNKLTLNISETHFMVFHRDKHTNYNIKIEFNKEFIEQATYPKFGLV